MTRRDYLKAFSAAGLIVVGSLSIWATVTGIGQSHPGYTWTLNDALFGLLWVATLLLTGFSVGLMWSK